MKAIPFLLLVNSIIIISSCNVQTGSSIESQNKIGGLYEINESGEIFSFYNNNETFKLDTASHIPFKYFESIKKQKSQYDGIYSVYIKLNPQGALLFKDMTERNKNKQLCLIINNKIMAAPLVTDIITSGQLTLMIADKNGLEEIINYLQN
jgi:preprotein translocase subunit SecD